jgi:predicted anti-sigma-YlaC factor YlaD
MIRCIFIKKKLYDYLDDSLSELDKDKVKRHLERCFSCRKRLEQIDTLLALAKQKNIPQPSDEFWHNFQIGLDRKFRIRPSLSLRLKPVFAYASLLVAILTLGVFLNFYTSPTLLSKTDLALVNEISMLEELTQETYLNHSEEAYIEEIEILSALDQELT